MRRKHNHEGTDARGTAPRKRRVIAILGGGPAGLAAAHELTSYPGWQDHYEVVVYQMGWRLGGKTATGRGPNGRVEEHGIHILQGWYHNAFRMLREVYDERRRAGIGADSPFQHWRQALDSSNSTLLSEFRSDRDQWVHRALTLPRNRKRPGDGPGSTWQLIRDVAQRILAAVADLGRELGDDGPWEWLFGDRPGRGAGGVGGASAERLRSALATLLAGWRESQLGQAAVAWARQLLAGLEKLVQRLQRVVQTHLSEPLRWMFVLLDLAAANLRGILRDVYDSELGKFDYQAICHLDYREWLARHGASEMARYSAVVRFVYAGAYAYLNDGNYGGGLLAAGSVLRGLLAALGYCDSLVWFFKAGTGDTLIMPLYQVLAHRGVRFEFFHRVRAVHYADTGNIERVTIGRQVTLKGDTYDPRIAVDIDIDGQRYVIDAWPNRPRQEQIEEDIGDCDLESSWSRWQDVATETLCRGRDYDHLILAIPVAEVAEICAEIIDRDPRWRQMVTHVETTPTHSFQLWLRPTLEELGMRPREWGLPEGVVGANTVTYAHLGKSWTDCSLVLPYEGWPAHNQPRTLLYFTGVLPEDEEVPDRRDHGYPERQRLRVQYMAEQWLADHMGPFFPNGTRRECPRGLDLNLLVDWQRPGQAPRLSSQYFRANIDPSERYTLAKPTPRQYRLRTDASGFANLFLAGDWIDYGMNLGFFEGAVISGMQAAQAVMRIHYNIDDHRAILGEPDVLW